MNENWFREPRGGKEPWIGVAIGVLDILLAVIGWFGRDSLLYLLIGLCIAGFAGAELLPAERTWAAGVVRIVSFLCLLVAVGVLVVRFTTL